MRKLHELIDNEIKRRNSSKQDILNYITEKYINKYDKDISSSESKFISDLILEKLISYRKVYQDNNYDDTMDLIMYKYVENLVITIRDIKSTWLGKILFFFFKRYMIK